jgi:membrane-associated protein
LIPGLAGMSRLPYLRFLAWNAAGGVVWATGFIMLGYAAGSQYKRIEHYANYLGLVLLIVIGLVIYLRRRRSLAHGEAGQDAADPGPGSAAHGDGSSAAPQEHQR